MDIGIISLIGIIAGVVFFIFMCMKRVPMVIAACLASLLIILTSGQPIMEMVTVTWATSFSNFLKSYFLPLTLSAITGKLINDAGAARRIALSFYSFTRKCPFNPKMMAVLFTPLMYVILGCFGINGYVIVFSVIGIAKEILKEFDVPWRMYVYGGALGLSNMWIPGSLSMTNIAATSAAGVNIGAAPVLGILQTAVYLGVGTLLIWLDLRHAEKVGEGFMDTGAEFLKSPLATAQTADEENLPSLFLSILPLACTMILAALFGIHIIIALFIGLLIACAVYLKYVRSLMQSLGEGVSSAFAPLITTGAAVAVGGVVQAAPGFQIVKDMLSNLPPLLEGVGYVAIITFILGSALGGMNAMAGQAFTCLAAGGYSAAVSARLMGMAVFTALPPHSSSIANIVTLAKVDYRKVMVTYVRTSLISGAAAMVVALIAVSLGLAT